MSLNTNSFGLKHIIFIARDGEAWSVCGNHLRCKDLEIGKSVEIAYNKQICTGDLMDAGFELVEELPKAPPYLVEEFFGKEPMQHSL